MPLLPALLVTDSSEAVEAFKRTFFDDTFAGIHKLAPFDYALLVPYFAIMILLSFYGLHRYVIVWLFFKNRHRLPKPQAEFAEKTAAFEELSQQRAKDMERIATLEAREAERDRVDRFAQRAAAVI